VGVGMRDAADLDPANGLSAEAAARIKSAAACV
jgi:hypothetical protein